VVFVVYFSIKNYVIIRYYSEIRLIVIFITGFDIIKIHLIRIADMYAYGVGVPQSCDQAMVLMRSASGKPSVRARVKMGAMYQAGKCVPQDRVMAYSWMGRALELDPGSSVCFQASPAGRWLADIYELAHRQLRALGITAIYGGDWCTFSEREWFFSYRRDGWTGRMASLIWRAD
jgi:hypothetical protein